MTLYNIPSTNSSKVNIITEQETKDSFVHQPIKQVFNGVYVNYHDGKLHKEGSGVFFISTECMLVLMSVLANSIDKQVYCILSSSLKYQQSAV